MITDQADDKPVELPIAKAPPNQRSGRACKSLLAKTTLPDAGTDEQYQQPRDPRFDPRCNGSNDARHFVRNYAFLDEVKKKELDELNKALRKEKDPVKREKIKMTIGRCKNKMIDLKNKATKTKKCDKKAHLVEKYKELKQSGKLSKYLERKRKKLIKRDQKAFS